MSDHVVENNPKKELLFALGGIGLFLGLVLLIGISAFLRPAGEHITAETTEASAAADKAEAIAAEPAAAPATAAVATDPADTSVGAGETAVDTPADATVTPAPGSGDAVVAAEAGTATTSGTVNQAAVQDTDGADLTAERADGDVDAGAAKPAPAQ